MGKLLVTVLLSFPDARTDSSSVKIFSLRILRHTHLRPITADGQVRALSLCMKDITLSVPQFGVAVGSRAALGVGIGFLLAGRLNRDQRQGAGWALLAVGILTTIPVVMSVIGGRGGDRPVPLAA